MELKLFESERRVMEVLWEQGECSAKEIAVRLGDEVGWNKNTTYTVLKKCIEKGAVTRTEPGFVCRAEITREQVQRQEANDLCDRLFQGSTERLFATLLSGRKLSGAEIERLRAMVDALEKE